MAKSASKAKVGASRVPIDGVAKPYPAEYPDKRFRQGWGWSGPEIVINWTKYRTEWRKTASLSRVDFVNAAAEAGLMTDPEAIDGARGIWPASFNGALNDMTAKEKREAKVAWAGGDTINRNHPLIALVGQFKGQTDEQLDALFGYDGQ